MKIEFVRPKFLLNRKRVVPKYYNKRGSPTFKVKAIIFDVNGVLLKGKGSSVHQYMAKKLKCDLETWFDAIEPYWNEMIKDETVTSYYLSVIASSLNVSKHNLEKLLIRAFKNRFRKDRKMFLLLKKLKKKYKLAILSDQLSISYNAFKKYNFDKRVDVSIWSHQHGIRKPDIEIFRITCKKLRTNPKNCIFIDNRHYNLPPAKKLGMKTILFKDYAQCTKSLRSLGVSI